MSDVNKKSLDSSERSKPNFWTTLPGILTGIAALGTAAAALIGGLTQAGYIPRRNIQTAATQSTPQKADSSGSVTSRANDPTTATHPGTAASSDNQSLSPREFKFTASTSAGEAEYKVLSARLDDFGTDSLTNTKTLLLRLRIRVTNHGRYDTLFAGGAFRLGIDDVVRAPRDSPSKAVAGGASEDGEVTFVVPEDAKKLTLRVGYSEDARSDIPLTFMHQQ